jgi:hypothetical protein
MSKPILSLLLLVLSGLTLWAVADAGLWSLWLNNLSHPAGIQVFADLGIALTLVLAWMWRDAAAQGRRFWPWAFFTLVVGSFGPLLYLLSAKTKA